MQINFENASEKNLPAGGHYVESAKASFIYWLDDDHQVSCYSPRPRSRLTLFQLVVQGSLKAQFDASQRLDVLDWVTTEHNEYIPRAQLLQAAAESPELKQSPTMSKATSKRAQQRQKQQLAEKDQPPQAPIPKSIVNEWGTTPAVSQFLEVITFCWISF